MSALNCVTVIDPFERQCSTFLDSLAVKPDRARRRLYNNTIRLLLKSGVWARLDIFYLFAAHNEEASRVNLKLPGSFTATLVDVPTFTVDRGWQGDVVNDALETGWDPVGNPGVMAQDDAMMAVGSNTAAASSSGADCGSGTLNFRIRQSDLFKLQMNGANTDLANTDGSGRFLGQRTGATASQAFRNNVSLGTTAAASSGLTAIDFRFLGRSGSNTFGSRQQWYGALGGSLNTLQLAAFDNALAAYQEALGF